VSEHFGEAPFFGLATVRTADGQVERQEVLANPHTGVEKAKGIRVGEWLVGLKIDVVLLREDVHGKGPAYVFADAGVETRLTQEANMDQAITEQREPSK
jgi:predicted Fe-Mo cluster-binding NifX family protein